jgi:hypothetical protein
MQIALNPVVFGANSSIKSPDFEYWRFYRACQ